MKKFYLLIILIYTLNINLNQIYGTNQSTNVPDTIIKKSGVPLIGKVEKKTKFEVYFKLLGNREAIRINNEIIKEIRYGNGKIEVLEAKTGQMGKEQVQGKTSDWSRIIVANEGSNLSGFNEKGEIEVEYTATRINMSNSELIRNGEILLKKRAASMKGNVIKITSKNITREYGAFPFIKMKAMVYSVE